ncbi:hypothetical protein [Sphingomonas sp. Y38-1Y]|uniref:hypothetical protein n=1 Tax=Sphingomonas sp. Y38-1Y TaxID=3078265 RepID=UPI0028EE48CB|nr:hypothetical protein [Sphingomonas sp. Y38-1Y]
MTAALDLRLLALAPAALSAPLVQVEGRDRCILFLSASDGDARAVTVCGVGGDPGSAWNAATEKLRSRTTALRWLRLDWVRVVEASDWRTLGDRLGRTKRNYFRLGIAIDAGFEHAFLETELNANAMLYGGPAHGCALLNEANFARYARLRDQVAAVDFAGDAPIWLFATDALFLDEAGGLHPITGRGRVSGIRDVPDAADPALLTQLIDGGARYLATQVGDDGRFSYGWHACFDRPIESYNSLRHASTVYAMLEAWEVTRDPLVLAAIDRALVHLVGDLIVRTGDAAFVAEANGELKLGGNAVALLALVKHAELMGTEANRPLMERLANGIVAMQDAHTGRFVHVLDHPSLAVKDPFRIIYYDGEAAFALTRMYELTGDISLLRAVERAFDHFIDAGHAKAHDHWLAYAVEALSRYSAHPRYFKFGVDNVRGYLDFVERRITTFPTLLELMMATRSLIERMRRDPGAAPMLASLDLDHFDRAMHARARHLLTGRFWPELAMFYANPDRIVGSFFIRHHGFRVRIDDVEHYLSALIAYRRHLIEGAAARTEPLRRVASCA